MKQHWIVLAAGACLLGGCQKESAEANAAATRDAIAGNAAAARSAAFQRVVADLAQRPVSVPRQADAVCIGAAMQAAAVLHGVSPDEMADAWGMGSVREVEPDPRVEGIPSTKGVL